MDDMKDKLNTWGAVVLVIFAVAWGMVYKGVSGETLADAVKDIGGALIPIFAAIFAARLVHRDLPAEQRFLLEGERAMEAVQGRHPDHLQGPKYDREGYDPEAGGKGQRYLFIQTRASKKRASLVALPPMSEGVVAVTISKGNLKYLGKADGEEDITNAMSAVNKALTALMGRLDPNGAEHTCLEVKGRVAIAVDLDERAMGPRRFRQTAEQLMEEALTTLLSLPDATPSA